MVKRLVHPLEPLNYLNRDVTNVALPDDFDKLLATMRSREIYVSIIIQNIAQLKALFEKQWESIIGNCDEFLFLGGNEQSTHKFVSEQLGKETIDTNTFGRSRGRNGNYSTNYQISGRELLTPDEVRRLDNQYAVLFIRGERPIKDLKYDIMKHPNIRLTADIDKKLSYKHGFQDSSIGEIYVGNDIDDIEIDDLPSLDDYYIYSSEELENYLKNLED